MTKRHDVYDLRLPLAILVSAIIAGSLCAYFITEFRHSWIEPTVVYSIFLAGIAFTFFMGAPEGFFEIRKQSKKGRLE